MEETEDTLVTNKYLKTKATYFKDWVNFCCQEELKTRFTPKTTIVIDSESQYPMAALDRPVYCKLHCLLLLLLLLGTCSTLLEYFYTGIV